ncbi:N-acetyltransferase domain-containing protein [Mucor velutinosus]|uniref:N-acetyltransferase domain-containing protein n=1 Tax=Mucor velutinosus TaxID=708070 RepID=A0AAN7D746_9FUNG|nr:N-acetyltransferase domain-containing protein [Mucor velutinosus]
MFSNILTVTKVLFQQFQLTSSPNAFDPYQADQFYEELNQDVHAGSNSDFSLCDEEDMVLVDKMEDEKDVCFIHGYCIKQPSAKRMRLIVANAAKEIIKNISTGASSTCSTASSRKKKLQKKAMDLVYVEEKASVMRGYGVDFCPLFERPYDSNFCVDLSDRKNCRNADGEFENKYINIPMKSFSSLETENDSWELV